MGTALPIKRSYCWRAVLSLGVTRWRFGRSFVSLQVCAWSAAGLLMCSAGGAVAVADPDSSGSAANGANDSGQQSSTDAKNGKKDEKKDGTDTKDGGRSRGAFLYLCVTVLRDGHVLSVAVAVARLGGRRPWRRGQPYPNAQSDC